MREFRLTKAQKAKLNNSRQRKAINEIEKADRERQAHIKWCKEKAIETIKAGGNPRKALVSFEHNMRSKPVTWSHPALLLIPQIYREYCTTKDIQEFIEGFN